MGPDRRRRLDADPPVVPAVDLEDATASIDMSLDEVAAEQGLERGRLLEIHLRTLDEAPQRGHLERTMDDIEGDDAVPARHHGQAAAGDADRGARIRERKKAPQIDLQPGSGGGDLHRANRPYGLDESCEHG